MILMKPGAVLDAGPSRAEAMRVIRVCERRIPVADPKFIPFRADMLREILAGRKTMTTRTRRYGHAGEVLAVQGGHVQILTIERMPLCLVAERFYAQEGFDSPEAFRQAWAEIHPGRGWTPELRVWVHKFRLMEARNV